MGGSRDQQRVLMIALDAAEPRLVEKWTDRGILPNLKGLLLRGAYGRLASTADWLAGSPWPTFYTGTIPAEHGLYHSLQWNADRMRVVRPTPDWLPLRPFWYDLSKKGPRVIAMDIPMKYPPELFNGLELYCWATHDRMGPPSSSPPWLLKWVREEFGSPPLGDEVWGPQRVKDLLRLRDQLIRVTSSSASLACALLRREKWDLFMVSFAATHRGGHKLWDLSSTWGGIGRDDRVSFSKALRDVYVACDAAVGQLVEAAGHDVTLIVFSLHGMGPNRSRAYILPMMLDRILGEKRRAGGGLRGNNLLRRIAGLKEFVPLEWRYALARRLPSSLQTRFHTLQFGDSVEWTTTRATSLTTDLQGFIRVNLRGRERAGIVEPGEEYDRLCADIGEGLKTFVDTGTGKPIVETVTRSDQLFKQGLHLNELPDMLVRWVSSEAAKQKMIISADYGSIPWPMKGRNPDGRSGNHSGEGFLLAAGDAVRLNSRIRDAHILDLAPTVLALFNAPKPVNMCGKALPVCS